MRDDKRMMHCFSSPRELIAIQKLYLVHKICFSAHRIYEQMDLYFIECSLKC